MAAHAPHTPGGRAGSRHGRPSLGAVLRCARREVLRGGAPTPDAPLRTRRVQAREMVRHQPARRPQHLGTHLPEQARSVTWRTPRCSVACMNRAPHEGQLPLGVHHAEDTAELTEAVRYTP